MKKLFKIWICQIVWLGVLILNPNLIFAEESQNYIIEFQEKIIVVETKDIPIRTKIKAQRAQQIERVCADILLTIGDAAKFKVKHQFKYLPFIAVELEKDNVSILQNSGYKIYPDAEVKAMLTDTVDYIGASQIHGIATGSGITIAIIDSGVDYNHPDLADGYIGGDDFVNEDDDPMDDYGHGTHVAGIAAGNMGVAPDSLILAYKVLNDEGKGSSSKVIEAIEKAIDEGADIINLSIGAEKGDSDDPLSKAVNEAVDQGIVVTVPAGNAGVNEAGEEAFMSITSPGTAEKAITVGSIDKDYNLSSFSSRGPVIGDLYLVKPEIVTFGREICSSSVAGTGAGECPTDRSGVHIYKKGTSMASPHVAGAAALLLELNSNLTPEEIKALILQNAEDSGFSDIRGKNRLQLANIEDRKSFITPAIVNLGMIPGTDLAWTSNKNLLIKNNESEEKTFSFRIENDSNPYISYEFDPAEITIPAGQTDTVSLTVTASSDLPFSASIFEHIENRIIANNGSYDIKVPVYAAKLSKLALNFSKNFEKVIIHDRGCENGFFKEIKSPGLSHDLYLPTGSYDVIVVFRFEDSKFGIIVKEGIPINGDTVNGDGELIVSIDESNAKNTYTLDLADAVGVVNKLENFYGTFKYKECNIANIDFRTRSRVDQIVFSDISSSYTFNWEGYVKSENEKRFYVIRDSFSGISEAVDFHRNQEDFAKININTSNICPYCFVQVESVFEKGSDLSDDADNYESTLLETEGYITQFFLLPSPSEDFEFNLKRIAVYKDEDLIAKSSILKAVGAHDLEIANNIENNVFSKLPLNDDSEFDYTFGMGPITWSGCFYNSDTRLSLRPCNSAESFFSNFYLDTYYKEEPTDIFLIEDDVINKFSIELTKSLNANITAREYKISIPIHYEFLGNEAQVTFEGLFNTRLASKNPPMFTEFMVYSEGKMKNFVNTNEETQIVFNVPKKEGIELNASVRILYNDFSVDLTVVSEDNAEYIKFIADVPAIPNLTWVNLYIEITDNFGGYAKYEMSPGFIVDYYGELEAQAIATKITYENTGNGLGHLITYRDGLGNVAGGGGCGIRNEKQEKLSIILALIIILGLVVIRRNMSR